MRSSLNFALVIAFAFCITTGSAKSAYFDEIDWVCDAGKHTVDENYFGLIYHRVASVGNWPTVTFGSLRLWDSYLKWSDIQPSPDSWRFSAFDKQVDLGERAKKYLIYTLGQTPTWASNLPTERHAYGMGSGGMPKEIAAWQNYVRAVAGRYKGRINAYEIWNEPKYSGAFGCKGMVFFCGTPDDLVDLARTAHEVIKSVDPKALIASPGFTDGLDGVRKLDRFLAAGGWKYIDVISFHFYDKLPENTIETFAALRTLLTKHNISHLPIWNTEVGYLVQTKSGDVRPEHSHGPFAEVLTPLEAGARLARNYILSASCGASKVFWYAWDNKRMGMIDPNSHEPNEMVEVFDSVSRWLINGKVKCGRLRAGEWVCHIERGGRTAKIYWVERGKSRLDFPRNVNMVHYLIKSRLLSNSDTGTPLSFMPILIADDHIEW